MSTAPSTDNYTLGKGHLTFDQLDDAGSPTGELSLGNAPAFTFSLSIDKLDHYSSLGGLKAKDKTVITEISPTCTFTLDELSGLNINKLFMGTSTLTQQLALTDGTASSTAIASAVAGQYYSLDDRQIGIYRAVWTEGVAGLAVDDVLTDTGTSTTCVIQHLDTIGGIKYMWFSTLTGASGFTLDGAWTSDGTGTGNFVGTPAVVDDVVVDDGTTQYVAGTIGGSGEFTISNEMGRLFIPTTTTMTLTALTIHYVLKDANWNVVNGLQTTAIEGLLRYVSDNPEGPNMEIRMWKVSLTPDGDTAFIGDDWSTMSFTGEILKDATGHPANPYLEVIVAA